ncbi:MAG TPA: glycosyltransferase family A protein [Parafilimonas sp.]|nr:glycosyltransferase family A protein [Parafilimonas sp.]
MPKVSVIIPNYNHAVYLKQRIDSVLNQSYTDYELIILDDCSTDNSKEIIEQYRDNEKLTSIVYNEVNTGNSFKQWDKGIQLAKGKYIWIAESDDWCEKNFLETIIAGMEKKENVVFGYCQSICVNDKGEIIFQSGYPRLEDYYPSDKFLEDFLCFGNAVYNASMAVFKKSFYLRISDTYKQFQFAGDKIFWAELSRLGDVYISGKLLNYFRKHSGDVSGKMYAKGSNFIEEIKVLDHFHMQLGLDERMYFRAKVKLYNNFRLVRTHIDQSLKTQIQKLFFKNISFFKSQYFLTLSYLYFLKTCLNKKLNRPYKTR